MSQNEQKEVSVEDTVTPWNIEATSDEGVDYDKLIKQV